VDTLTTTSNQEERRKYWTGRTKPRIQHVVTDIDGIQKKEKTNFRKIFYSVWNYTRRKCLDI